MPVQVEKAFEIRAHMEAIYALCGDGDAFFSAGADGHIMQGDIQSPGKIDVLVKVPDTLYSMALQPEQKLLFAAGRRGILYGINIEKREEVFRLKMASGVFKLALIKNTSLVLTAGADGWIGMADLPSQKVIKNINAGESNIRSLAIHPSGGGFAVGTSDNLIRVFDLDLNERTVFEAHSNSVFSLCYTPNGKYILSGGRDALLNAWHDTSYELIRTLPAHLYTINDITWATGHRNFFTASRDKSVKVWDAMTLSLLKVIDRSHFEAHSHSVNTLYWTEKHDLLLSAGDDRKICGWKISLMPEEE